MSDVSMIAALVSRLEAAGYSRLKTPLQIASVEFEFTAALLGTGARSLDLIVLIDAAIGQFGDTDGEKVRHRIETLSRALDISQSRLTLSLILAGAALTENIEALSETCRVLTVPTVNLNAAGEPSGDTEHDLLDDRIRVLLPLELPLTIAAAGDERRDAIRTLLSELPAELDKILVDELTKAADLGEAAVSNALSNRLENVLGHLEGEP